MMDIQDRHFGQKTMEECIAKGFNKDVYKLVLRRNMQSLDETKLNLLTDKMTIHIDVLCENN
jgi:hypothetical protein